MLKSFLSKLGTSIESLETLGSKELLKIIFRKIKRAFGLKKTPALSYWQTTIQKHRANLHSGYHDYKYFSLVRKHCYKNNNYYKILPLFTLPLLIQARNIVELGSAFTYYPETYFPKTPWGKSNNPMEGLVSTRILLTACHFLNKVGIPATLTSVDMRGGSGFIQAKRLLEELDLLKYWQPVMNADSVKWLKEYKKTIDFALVDTSHTYSQVSAELESLHPLMANKSIVVIDDGFTISDEFSGDWRPQETDAGRSKGGEYGAICDFLKIHPEWHAEWVPPGMVYLYKKIPFPTST